MQRRITRSIDSGKFIGLGILVTVAIIALLLLVSTPRASAFVPNISLFYGTNGNGLACQGLLDDWPNLDDCAGDPFGNLASSYEANLLVGQCVKFWTGRNYTGNVGTKYGPLQGDLFNFSVYFNNNVESLKINPASC